MSTRPAVAKASRWGGRTRLQHVLEIGVKRKHGYLDGKRSLVTVVTVKKGGNGQEFTYWLKDAMDVVRKRLEKGPLVPVPREERTIRVTGTFYSTGIEVFEAEIQFEWVRISRIFTVVARVRIVPYQEFGPETSFKWTDVAAEKTDVIAKMIYDKVDRPGPLEIAYTSSVQW